MQTVQKTGDSPGAVLGLVGTPIVVQRQVLGFDSAEKLWKYRKCSALTGWSMFPLLQFIDKVWTSL